MKGVGSVAYPFFYTFTIMKLKKKHIGGKAYSKQAGRFIELIPENAELLKSLGLTEYFEKDAINNEKPNKPSLSNRKRKSDSNES